MIRLSTITAVIVCLIATSGCDEGGVPDSDDSDIFDSTSTWNSETDTDTETDSAVQVATHVYVADADTETGTGVQISTDIYIDEGHNNYHTLSGSYAPLGKVMAEDGFRVFPLAAEFTSETLADADILVIANAQHNDNVLQWECPILSAFTNNEIEAVRRWVAAGGSLFLLADHMPFAGAAQELAAAFQIVFYNGFVLDKASSECRSLTFSSENGLLARSAVTWGTEFETPVDSVTTFCGQGFSIPQEALPLLLLDAADEVVFPQQSWVWDADTPRMEARGLVQGAIMHYGQGRIAVLGEAGMFTCIGGTSGMCSPIASQNRQFLLNTLHWLDAQTDL